MKCCGIADEYLLLLLIHLLLSSAKVVVVVVVVTNTPPFCVVALLSTKHSAFMVCGEHVPFNNEMSRRKEREMTHPYLHHLNAGEQSGAKEHQNNFTPTPKQQQPPNDDAPLFLRLSRFRVVVVLLFMYVVVFCDDDGRREGERIV